MANIIKHETITIKCSNPIDVGESITFMAVESNTKLFPTHMLWIYSNSENLPKDEFMPTNYLQTTLSDTLNHFPLVAGRLTEDDKGNATVHMTNEGVFFTEAECPDQTVDFFVPRTSSDEQEFDYENINKSNLSVPVKNNWTGPCMSIQVTRLKCHSVILTISAFHCLFDAQSMAHFINTWASAQPPNPKPFFDRNFILCPTQVDVSRPNDCVFTRTPIPPTISTFVDPEQQQRVITRVYHFSSNELKNIKAEASKNLPNSIEFISTYDALYAHMILVIAQATQTSLTDGIKILQSFNGRSTFVSSVSSDVRNYFGSFPFWLYGVIPTDCEPTLSSLAQFIHRMYSKQTESSLRIYNAYLTSDDGAIQKNRVDADIINRDFHCASWRKGHLLGAKFANSGYPIYSGPGTHLYPRYFPMMDANDHDESVNIILGLRENDYQRMIEQKLLHKYR